MFESVTDNQVVSELLGALGIDRRKIFQCLGLFCFLVVIYSMCLPGYLTFVNAEHGEVTFSDLIGPLVKFCVVSALPFAVLAYSDKSWRTSDAAPVCVAAWSAVCAGLSSKFSCLITVMFPFVPFIFAAVLAHAAGTLCRFLNDGKMKSIFGS
jgi:hypothetical protein